MRIFRTLAIALVMCAPTQGLAALLDTPDADPRETQDPNFGWFLIEFIVPEKDAMIIPAEAMRLLSDPEKIIWDMPSEVVRVSGSVAPPAIDFRGRIPGFVPDRLPPQARPSSDRTPVIVFLPAPVLLLATALATLCVFARRSGEGRRLPRSYLRQGLETLYRRRIT